MSLKEKMTALADAVREKAELTDTLTIDEMTEAVNGLVVNGIEVDERTLTVTPSKSQQNFTSSELGENAYYSSVTVNAIPDEYITTDDATAVSGDILRGKTAYVNGEKITGTIFDRGDVVTSINFADAEKTLPEGYYKSARIVNQTSIRSLKVTPSKDRQYFNSQDVNVYLCYTTVTVDPIPDEYIITSDATAVASDILEGKTAYVNGEKVTGAMINHGSERIDVKSGTSAVSIDAPGFYSSIIVNIERPNITSLEITPSKETQRFVANDGNIENGEEFFDTVTVKAIPDEYITTTDATAVSGDILEGKTAYVNGEKVTGTLKEAQQASVEANAVTIFPGIVSEEYTVTVAEMAAVTVDSNVVTVPAGYNSAEQIITVGTAKEAETFTPGTSDITIPADTYLTGEQVIRGDSNLTPENIKTGVSIFDVEGIFTADADATASDIAQGKTAYVKGEKITGTASGGAVAPYWDLRNGTLITPIPPCDAFGVPARGMGIDLKVFNGELWRTTESSPIQFDKSINWTYVYPRNNDEGFAIGDGKLFYVTANSSSATITPLFPSLSGITQVCGFGWGTLCCTESGELYGGGGNDFTKVRRVEYTRENSTDPVVYVNVSKILNCSQDYQNFWVITDDGSLASGWLDKEAFDYSDGAAYAEIDTQSVANGNPFLNYFPQNVDEYGGDSTQTYELAFRADGLWYRQAGTYYDSTDRTTKRYSWNKANDPGLRKYDWLGYCSMIGNASYEGYDEETGEDIYKYSLKEYAIALHIDEQGRLWKIAPKGEIISTEYEFVNFKLTGLSITQVGEDTDWQCVPPMMRKGYGGQDRPTDNTLGQKGGKVINMWCENTDTADIGWQEWRLSPPGRMVGCDRVYVYFAPEGASVDMSNAGGTF
ncbi:MAG: hypothetical protein IKB99_03815 [Lentisphaeria bacterium]|nr:hypothetical protein [Lentisphaeria bacterium]